MSPQEPLFHAFLESASLPALLVGPGGEVRRCNRAAETVLGLPRSELVGRPLRSVCAVAGSSKPGEVRLWSTHEAGRPFRALASVVAVEAGRGPADLYVLEPSQVEGRPSLEPRFQDAILEIARSRELASGDFAAATERIARVAASALDVERVGVWLLREGGSILECVTLFQPESGEASSGTRLRAEDYPEYFAAVEEGRAIAASNAREDPRTSKFAEGYLDVLGISSLLDAVVRAHGRVIGIVCHEKVGDPRRWRDDEIAFSAEIADQVASAWLAAEAKESAAIRTRLEDELRQAHKLEAIGRLAGGIAHDFNNLLSVILGHAELALAHEAGETVHECLGGIRSAGERAAELVDRLLSIGRRRALETSIVDLDDVVESVLHLLSRVLPANVAIEAARAEPGPLVVADAAQLEQALMNLCLNARDALIERGGRIVVSTRTERDVGRDRSWSVVEVADDGQGMPEAVLERAFDPFFSTKTEAKGAGTGLGLSMVYGIARQHGGHVDARSRVGEGTRIALRFPAWGSGDDADAETAAAAAREETPPALPAPRGSGERILVAEDAESVRDIARRVLEEAGYLVTTVRDGAEAVQRHAEMPEEIDLVLLDVLMPKRGGRAAFELIRQRCPDVAVLFTTGYGASEITPELLDEHGIEVLRKPWNATALLNAVARALRRREAVERR